MAVRIKTELAKGGKYCDMRPFSWGGEVWAMPGVTGEKTKAPTKKIRTPFFLFLFWCFIFIFHPRSSYSFVSPDLLPFSPLNDVIFRLDSQRYLSNRLNAFGNPSESYMFFLLSGKEGKTEEDPFFVSDREHVLSFLRYQGITQEKILPNYFSEGMEVGFLGSNSTSKEFLGVGAHSNPLLMGEFGRWNHGGITLWAQPRLSGRFQGWFALDVVPLLPLSWKMEEGETEISPSLDLAYVKLGHQGLEFTGGRFREDWGHAQSGSFILGGEQPSLTGFRLKNSHPIVLPWIFQYLGNIQFSLVGARLSEDQFFPHSYFIAQRMNIRPKDWLELGYAQSIILGGEGSPNLSCWNGLKEVLGRRVGDPFTSGNFSNRNFLFDYRVQIPPLQKLSFYGEFFFEDCCSSLFWRDISSLVGSSLPFKVQNRPWVASLEWIRTTEIVFRHGTFLTGFADRDYLLGHPLGPDAMGFYFSLHGTLHPSLWFKTQLAYERRGRNELSLGGGDIRSFYPGFEAPEDRLRMTFSPVFYFSKKGWIKTRVGYEWVSNFFYQDSIQKHHGFGAVEIGFNM